MSQDQRIAFHLADGVDDWRVLYCGPVACFETASLQDAAAFAVAIAGLDELDGLDKLDRRDAPPLIDVRPNGVTIRLTADVLDLEASGAATAAARARAISDLARQRGLTPRPDRLQDTQVAIATVAPVGEVLPFWRAVLGYDDHTADDLVDPRGRGPTVWFQQLDPARSDSRGRTLRHAMHVDLAVPREQLRARLAEALAEHGRVVVDLGPRYQTFADPAGNKVDLVSWPDLPVHQDDAHRYDERDFDADGTPGSRSGTGTPATPAAGTRTTGRPLDPGAGAAEAPDTAGAADTTRITFDEAAVEAAWMAFREASDLDDWPIVFSGPSTWFATESLARSAELAAHLAAVDGAERLDLDVRAGGLAVRLVRDLSGMDETHLDLARRLSAAAHEFGVEADPSRVQTMQIAIASHPEDDVRPFWRELFRYRELGDEDLVSPHGRGPNLWFQSLAEGKALRHAFHLDVSVPLAIGQARVDAALAAGGRIADQRDGAWWTLADPVGNKVDIAVWADRGGRID
ncbi:VOC family protein [Agromyces sp. LHK192]|uniref:VOC family protein n=1 Tax=Agromyces sp. LHK192 TaxID=2498704 RepID=UPI0013E37557|nr:VOC family protein [Agromyces sp. LHK192]